MSKCCVPTHTGASPLCPMNGKPTKPVGRITLEKLIKPEFKPALLAHPYYFCNAPDCHIVYVSERREHLITKDMLIVRVGIKETEDPIRLCYCFGYERSDIQDDIRLKNDTNIEKIIRQRVNAKECWCEEANPSGTCCLGEVAKAIKLAKTLNEQGLL